MYLAPTLFEQLSHGVKVAAAVADADGMVKTKDAVVATALPLHDPNENSVAGVAVMVMSVASKYLLAAHPVVFVGLATTVPLPDAVDSVSG
jgi:hypothetical protein